jgi:hypothetical protein
MRSKEYSMFNIFKKRPYVHQYLKLPVMPEIDLFSLFPDNKDQLNHVELDPKTMLNKEFVDFMESIPGLRIPSWEAFYTPPGGKIWIHGDSDKIDDFARINLSWGPKDSELIWWEPKPGIKLEPIVTSFGVNYLRAEEHECVPICRAVIDRPSIVQVGMLHSTWNPGPEGRWTLAIPLAERSEPRRVGFEMAVAMFADYVTS